MGSVHTPQKIVFGSATETTSCFSCCTRGRTAAAATAEEPRPAADPAVAPAAAEGTEDPLQNPALRNGGPSIFVCRLLLLLLLLLLSLLLLLQQLLLQQLLPLLWLLLLLLLLPSQLLQSTTADCPC